MSEFVSSMFNFDSRFFQSFAKLLIPGKLTKEYIAGKRKRYLNPARFFLFSMLFHFAVLAYVSKDVDVTLGDLDTDITKLAARAEMVSTYDSLVNHLQIDSTQALDSLRSKLFGDVIDGVNDSIGFSDNSMIKIEGVGESSSRKFHTKDILNMKEAEFLDHYKIKGFTNRIFTRQLLRMSRDPQALFSYYIGNLLWAVVLSILFLSFILKLLYIRSKRFFVEHLILLMHIHSFVFVLVGIALLTDILTNNAIGLWLWATAGITFIYFFFSFYRYYEQGLFKTFMKYMFFLLCYSVIIGIFATVILLISLLVF